MFKVVLLLVYLLNGELKIEQRSFDDAKACMLEGGKRTATLQAMPGFQEGLFAGCIHAKVTEVKGETK